MPLSAANDNPHPSLGLAYTLGVVVAFAALSLCGVLLTLVAPYMGSSLLLYTAVTGLIQAVNHRWFRENIGEESTTALYAFGKGLVLNTSIWPAGAVGYLIFTNTLG